MTTASPSSPPALSPEPAAKHPFAAVAVLGFASLCAALMQSLVIPIQPVLPEILSTSPGNASWVVTATLLGGAVAMPVAGRIADIKGKKPVLVVSAIILLVGSLICALSTTLLPVLIGRVLQGIAMGYIPVAISYVGELVPTKMKNSAVAGISATLGVGGALGLPIAAWIAEEFNWQALFALSSVLAVIVTVLSATLLPYRAPKRTARLDVVGALGLAAGVVSVLVGVSKGNEWGWSSLETLIAISGGVVVLIGWGLYELRHKDPLVDLRATARRPVLLTNLAALLIGFGMMAQSIVVPQLLEMPASIDYGLGQTMLEAGLWMAPGGVMMLAFTPISSRLLTRLGGRSTLAIGATVLAGGYVFAFFLTAAPWQLMIATCIASAGVGIGYAAMPTLVMQNSPRDEAGAAVGVNSLMRSMGTTVAGAVMAIVLTSQTVPVGETSVPAESAFTTCFAIGALAALAGAGITLCIRRQKNQTDAVAEAPEPRTAPTH
ncbi:MFS transporter [Paramicrobacterium chengjingii]|uniref:MFS transporter n=1 Tax=Paramicrobacterium chengjingii TaxID=2769067 RepID=A0ABX6YJM9_9MICO|nr:MFS transporter [Microbacterium chengjingii]QPZ38611.1 MFS transporter [Microbacterium chengjingii]